MKRVASALSMGRMKALAVRSPKADRGVLLHIAALL
jgi:hypothetical protein